jgi:hypothetical protein
MQKVVGSSHHPLFWKALLTPGFVVGKPLVSWQGNGKVRSCQTPYRRIGRSSKAGRSTGAASIVLVRTLATIATFRKQDR